MAFSDIPTDRVHGCTRVNLAVVRLGDPDSVTALKTDYVSERNICITYDANVSVATSDIKFYECQPFSLLVGVVRMSTASERARQREGGREREGERVCE